MNAIFSYTLKQIASWTSDDSEVTIPALQRGLVWKPNQVELLWDSILRGFPIGSFLLSDVVEKKQKGKYYLMDGQQRYNAISIGFNSVQNPRAVLWIDLEPPTIKNSTRIFWIKATTTPHPWGFKNDDESRRLDTAEKRDAIARLNLQGNIYNNDFSLSTTWPVEANCPIPLFCLLKASTDNAELFLEDIKRNFERSDFKYSEKFLTESLKCFHDSDFIYKDKFNLSDEAKQYVKKELYPAFVKLNNYRVNCNHLPQIVMESETLADAGEQTTLEVLFTRLNTGGTQISREDLNYSAIKAYWPSIKDINDSLAEQYMSPSKLVMLAFRLALTGKNDDSLKNELSIKQIRSLAKAESERVKIEELYQNYLEIILKRIDEWLGVSEEGVLRTPSVLRTTIAWNSPDVYLLLMYFAYIDIIEPIELTASQIKALAFSLHWFNANNDKKGCVLEIFRKCKDGINLINIQKGFAQLMHDCKILHIYNPIEVNNFILKIEKSPSWRGCDVVPAPAKEFFGRIFRNGNAESREMLLYAERQYINSHFSNYDPARQDMWAEYNRPWDFDHIVARDRIDRKQGDYREYDKIWLDSIGNFAAISYESNRSKNNGIDFSEYHANKDALDFNLEVENLQYELTRDSKASMDFARITYDRFCKIYTKIFEIIRPIMSITVLPDILIKRKTLFNNVKGLFPEAIFHFAASDGNDYLLQRDQDWAREWIGVGVVKGEYMVCLEWQASKENETYEYGIRKAPGTSVTTDKLSLLVDKGVAANESNFPWWYICEVRNSIDMDFIKQMFDSYLSKI